MTEAEWLACDDPAAMLATVSGRASERKLRLFAVACCRRLGNRLETAAERNCLAAVELASDEPTASAQQDEALGVLQQSYVKVHGQGTRRLGAFLAVCGAAFHDSAEAALMTSAAAAIAVAGDESGPAWEAERREQSVLLRDVFGSRRSRRFTSKKSWRTSTVVALAEGIYADRAFDRLPILADALEDTGCDSADVLNHCRGEGPHVRGCWVVDLVLGKG